MFSNNKSFLLSLIFILTLFISGGVFAQHSGHEHSMDGTKKMKMADSASMKNKSSIVHSGVIDLKKIDANKDGKVYQDMMDYNVISDKPGKCPLCGMTLKEVTLKEAKETAVKAGYKVK